MCKSNPFRPCSPHAQKLLRNAMEVHRSEQSAKSKTSLDEALLQWLMTPEGISKIRKSSPDLAKRLQKRRKKLNDEAARFQKFSTSVETKKRQWLGDANLRPDLSHPVVRKAYEIAVIAHEGQVRKSGEVFLNHPLRTAKYLERMGFNHEVIAVALLHDSVEDSDLRLEDLSAWFGFSERIVAAVDSVTKRDGEIYSDAVGRASRNLIGQLVKLADNLDNSSEAQLRPFDAEKRLRQIGKYTPARKTLIRAIYQMKTYVASTAVDGVLIRPHVPQRAA